MSANPVFVFQLCRRVSYCVLAGNLEQVICARVVRLSFLNVIKSRKIPHDIDGGHVYAPDNDILAIGGDLLTSKIDLQVPNLVEEGFTVYRIRNPRREGCRITAAGGERCGGAGRVALWCTRVAEDGAAIEVIRASTVGGNFGPEPVVANGLVSGEDNIVPLADGEEYPVGVVGFDRNQVRCDYSEGVAVKGNTDGVVNGGVDQSETVLLARRNCCCRVAPSA